MINFKSRCESIRNADRITRRVNSVYPHISESMLKERISRQILYMDFNSGKSRRLSDLALKYADKIKRFRSDVESGIELLKNVIYILKNKRVGNCYETARLAEIVGKMNGQENIYPMKIFVSKNKSGVLLPLDHVVAVIPKKKIEANNRYEFKGNEAIVIDPWLGVTDFSNNYLSKLKNDYAHLFINMPDMGFSMRFLAKTSKNLAEFKQNKKEKVYNPTVKFLLHEDGAVKQEEISVLKNEYPELIIKDYKNI